MTKGGGDRLVRIVLPGPRLEGDDASALFHNRDIGKAVERAAGTQIIDSESDRLGQRGDSPDFSHIITSPYVDAVILDRRMAGYARAASRRLAHETGLGQFDEAKVFTTLEDWINH